MSNNSIFSLSEYIGIIERLQKQYKPGILGNPTLKTFLYRGICNDRYEKKLLPSIFRKHKHLDHNGDDEISIENYIYQAWANEINVLKAFILESIAYIDIPPSDLVRWAEYAQHFGVPTRLLDWTTSPLSALYFSCRNDSTNNGEVWLLHSANYERFFASMFSDSVKKEYLTRQDSVARLLIGKSDIEFPIIYTPYYVDSRMSAQGSVFMAWGTREEPLEMMLNDARHYMKAPDVDRNEWTYELQHSEALLFRFHIFADRKQPLLRELDAMGINEKTLFPGLDGVGRYIERKFRFDYNETAGIV